MKIGRFKITPLEFGHFRLDGGAMFGVVPKVLWSKFHPADENNQIDMVMRCPLVEVDNRVILIDTGFGEGRTEKFKSIYSFTGNANYLLESLKSVGLKREDITDVFVTHLHFDHNGGSTLDKAGSPKPTFPNATYYIQKRQLDHARLRLEKDKASYLPEDFEPLIESKVVNLVDGQWQLLPGFDCVICDGHTPAMQLARINDDNQTLLYVADLLPLASQVNLPWIMAYDLFPVTTLNEKKQIIGQAADEGWILMYEHDPNFIFSKVKRTEKGFMLDELK